MNFSWNEIVFGLVMTMASVLLAVVLYQLWYEATFDYTKCSVTDTYRDQHTNAWIQTIPGSNINGVTMPMQIIHHPARDWTERLYRCPDGNGHFDKWRNERKPQ